MSADVILSVVTGAVNRPTQLMRFVDSVVRHTRTASWELIIADASDTPIDQSRLPSNARVLPERPRLGHTRGYNVAFRASCGKYIIWGNDDAEVCEGYDVAAIEFMESHPKIGLGALHYSENGGPFHVNSAWGCLYANFGIFPRWLGEQVGFFDENLHMYGADNSLAIRILLAKYGVADIPNARILHHSEKDEIRAENQKLRKLDNQTLTSKYMPLRNQWRNMYEYRKFEASQPWAHGVNPEKVLA